MPRRPRHGFLRSGILASGAALLLVALSWTAAHANLPDRNSLRTLYGTGNTRLDDGTNNFPGGGCGVCHGLDTSPLQLTLYGQRYWDNNPANRTAARLTAIENEDADMDGWSNRSELLARFKPGVFAEHPGALSLAPPTQAQNGERRATVQYMVNLVNDGSGIDDFELSVTSTWNTTLSTTLVNNVGPGETVPITVSVRVLGVALDGQSDVATLTAVSLRSLRTAVDTAQITTTAQGGPLPGGGGAQLLDLTPGSPSTAPFLPTAVGGTLFFVIQDPPVRLMKSDGTVAGTTAVSELIGAPSALVAHQGVLYFVIFQQIWKSDGTAAGTVLVKNLLDDDPLFESLLMLTPVGNSIFFVALRRDGNLEFTKLWKTDGTAAGTVEVDGGNAGIEDLTRAGTSLYFTTIQSLSRADEASTGAQLVRSFPSRPRSLTDVNGTLFFSADDDLDPGNFELWKSDGTPGGTVLVKEINPTFDLNSFPVGSFPESLVNLNGLLVFTADDGTHGREVWRSDGSAGGTFLLEDIEPAGSSFPLWLTASGGHVFFAASDPVGGRELWKTDGSVAGTGLVKYIRNCPPCGPLPPGSGPEQLTDANGVLFFTAQTVAAGREPWKSDGTAGGTVLVRDITNDSNTSQPSAFTSANGTLFFVADDGVHGFELWRAIGQLDVEVVGSGTANPGVAGGPCDPPEAGCTVFPSGAVVTLAPVAGRGFRFARWEGACTGTGPCSLRMAFDRAVVAFFTQGPLIAFDDVPAGYFAEMWIRALVRAGVTVGCRVNPPGYCPESPVTREQMAIFLLKASENADYAPPPCTVATFGDVPCSNPFAPWIYELVRRGITAGCGGGLYCPTAPVTREQMAVFLLASVGDGPIPCAGTFGDVSCSSPFAGWIERLVQRGITAGCGNGNYCPASAVTRAQMAVFLVLAFDLPR